jgi:hypothetical protein
MLLAVPGRRRVMLRLSLECRAFPYEFLTHCAFVFASQQTPLNPTQPPFTYYFAFHKVK